MQRRKLMDAAVQTFSIHKRDVRRGQGLEEEDFIVGRVGAVGGGTPQMQARGWGELVARAHSDEDQDEENLLTRTRRTKRVYSHDTPPLPKGEGQPRLPRTQPQPSAVPTCERVHAVTGPGRRLPTGGGEFNQRLTTRRPRKAGHAATRPRGQEEKPHVIFSHSVRILRTVYIDETEGATAIAIRADINSDFSVMSGVS